MRLRALVLAAGLGKRLRPLTETTPKPLLPVAGRPILAWTLDRLAAVGCEAVAINLHHRGERIREHFGDRYRGLPLRYSEEEEILGTLGALGPLRPFFAAADQVLVINGDSLCRWPLKRLVRKHLGKGAQASLLVARRPDPERFGGGVGLDRQGRVVSFFAGDEERGEVVQRRVFAGAHVLSPSLLHRVQGGPSDFVTDLYLPLLSEGARIQGVVTGRRWHDLGTPRRYLEGSLDWLRGIGPQRLWRRNRVASSARVREGARLRQATVEAEAEVGAGAALDRVLVLPGARVGTGCRLSETILGPGARVPANSRVVRQVVVPQGKDRRAAGGVSVVSGMIFHPLDGAEPYRERTEDSSVQGGGAGRGGDTLP